MRQSSHPFHSPATGISSVIETTSGPVQGFKFADVETFLGIPYGSNPSGEKRFMPPQPPKRQDELISCFGFGPTAIQLMNGFPKHRTKPEIGIPIMQSHNRWKDVIRQSENCLTLNVWTKGNDDNRNKAVIVWFHGGAFNYGSTSWPLFNPMQMVNNEDVVFVSVAHRLNLFGFLNLSDLGIDEYKESGNVGILDLVLALEWIRDNINSFGGDKNNVTISGHSGGGYKVSSLLAVPKAKGLFHKATIQSGSPEKFLSEELSIKYRDLLFNRLRIDKKNCFNTLLKIDAKDLISAATSNVGSTDRLPPSPWMPVFDGNIIDMQSKEALVAGRNIAIPLIIGFNKDEFSLFQHSQPWWGELSKGEALKYTEYHYKGMEREVYEQFSKLFPAYSPTYIYNCITSFKYIIGESLRALEVRSQKTSQQFAYSFNWELPLADGLLKATHSIEAGFIFNSIALMPMMYGAESETFALANKISSAWAEFAKSGVPYQEDLPIWQPYTNKNPVIMELDNQSQLKPNQYAELVDLTSVYMC